jgi:hypothetical protein
MFGALIKFNEKNIEVVGDPQLKFNIEVGKINVQFTPELVPALLLISLNYNTHSQPLTLYNFEKAIVNSDCTGINKL